MQPTYLALGDSYTIGESVPLHESFPYQLVQQLRAKHPGFNAPEIVAKTGWTTNELATHLIHTLLQKQYDFVTLLIGVNNQYRNLSITEFDQEFTFLLLKALQYNGHQNNRVFVLSIPDWSHTPFAQNKAQETGLDLAETSAQIDAFNDVIKKALRRHGNRVRLYHGCNQKLCPRNASARWPSLQCQYASNLGKLITTKI